MYIFVVDAESRITARAATNIPKLDHSFADPKELARLVASWPGKRLVEIWNKLPHTKKVLRFTDRNTAIQRIWEAVQEMAPSPRKQSAASGRTRAPAKTNPFGARDGTKSGRIMALLMRPSGATLQDIMAETGWQAHSVRGFISGQSRRLGFRIKSFKQGEKRVYRIVKGESREHSAL
jgi:hypothetical protein